jgi:hypothetical protein
MATAAGDCDGSRRLDVLQIRMKEDSSQMKKLVDAIVTSYDNVVAPDRAEQNRLLQLLNVS